MQWRFWERETRLKEETGGRVGHAIPAPYVDQNLQSDLKGLTGESVLVPSTGKDWDPSSTVSPGRDWQPVRLGANPPAALGDLRNSVTEHLAAASGIPSALLQGRGVDATALREAWRLFLHSSVSPVARVVQEEMREKSGYTGPDPRLRWAVRF